MMSRNFTFLILFVALIAGCNQTTEPTTPGGNTAEINFTEQTDLPQTGGATTSIGFLPDHSMVAIIDTKLYKIPAGGGTPQLINGDAYHDGMAIGPDGSVYTPIYINNQGYAMRRYDIVASTFAELTFPKEPQANIVYRFSPSGEVFLCYSDKKSVYNDLYYSNDKGATWKVLPVPEGQQQRDVAFLPTGEILSTSSSSVYKSNDHGVTWQKLCTYPVNTLGLNIFVASNGDIFTYNEGGNTLHVSHDGGKTMTQIAWPASLPYTRQMTESGGSYFMVGGAPATQPTANQSGGGLLRSDDGGLTWKSIFLCYNVSSLAIKDGNIALGSGHGIFYKSTGSWTLFGMKTVETLNDIALDKDGNLLLIADQILYRRISGKWEVLNAAGSHNLTVTKNGTIVCASGLSATHSSDNGTSWKYSKVTTTLTFIGGPAIWSMTSNASNEIYAGVADYVPSIFGYGAGELLKSSDGGATFTSIYSKNNFTKVLANGNDLYGIWEYVIGVPKSDILTSTTFGLTWVPFTGKFPLCFNSENKYLAYRSVYNEVAFSLVTKSSGESKDLNTNIKVAASINKAIFGPDDKLYTILLKVGKPGIYVSAAAVK